MNLNSLIGSENCHSWVCQVTREENRNDIIWVRFCGHRPGNSGAVASGRTSSPDINRTSTLEADAQPRLWIHANPTW